MKMNNTNFRWYSQKLYQFYDSINYKILKIYSESGSQFIKEINSTNYLPIRVKFELLDTNTNNKNVIEFSYSELAKFNILIDRLLSKKLNTFSIDIFTKNKTRTFKLTNNNNNSYNLLINDKFATISSLGLLLSNLEILCIKSLLSEIYKNFTNLTLTSNMFVNQQSMDEKLNKLLDNKVYAMNTNSNIPSVNKVNIQDRNFNDQLSEYKNLNKINSNLDTVSHTIDSLDLQHTQTEIPATQEFPMEYNPINQDNPINDSESSLIATTQNPTIEYENINIINNQQNLIPNSTDTNIPKFNINIDKLDMMSLDTISTKLDDIDNSDNLVPSGSSVVAFSADSGDTSTEHVKNLKNNEITSYVNSVLEQHRAEDDEPTFLDTIEDNSLKNGDNVVFNRDEKVINTRPFFSEFIKWDVDSFYKFLDVFLLVDKKSKDLSFLPTKFILNGCSIFNLKDYCNETDEQFFKYNFHLINTLKKLALDIINQKPIKTNTYKIFDFKLSKFIKKDTDSKMWSFVVDMMCFYSILFTFNSKLNELNNIDYGKRIKFYTMETFLRQLIFPIYKYIDIDDMNVFIDDCEQLFSRYLYETPIFKYFENNYSGFTYGGKFIYPINVAKTLILKIKEKINNVDVFDYSDDIRYNNIVDLNTLKSMVCNNNFVNPNMEIKTIDLKKLNVQSENIKSIDTNKSNTLNDCNNEEPIVKKSFTDHYIDMIKAGSIKKYEEMYNITKKYPDKVFDENLNPNCAAVKLHMKYDKYSEMYGAYWSELYFVTRGKFQTDIFKYNQKFYNRNGDDISHLFKNGSFEPDTDFSNVYTRNELVLWHADWLTYKVSKEMGEEFFENYKKELEFYFRNFDVPYSESESQPKNNN